LEPKVWQILNENEIFLLTLNRFFFLALQCSQRGSKTVAMLLSKIAIVERRKNNKIATRRADSEV
jgi:hypothetical protein